MKYVHKYKIIFLVHTVAYLQSVGPRGACAPLTFSFTHNVLLNKQVTYLSCSCFMHMNNLEVVAKLCSHESIFSAGLTVQAPALVRSSAMRNSQRNESWHCLPEAEDDSESHK